MFADAVRAPEGTASPVDSATAADGHIAALDGLRFLAALFVAAAHYSAWVLIDFKQHDYLVEIIMSMSGLGMTLFFTLSGFVIHYNYRELLGQPGGLKKFVVARFSRLYPLFIVLFVIEFAIEAKHGTGSCGNDGHPAGLLFAWPYYVTLTQDWVYGVICKNTLIYQYGMMSAVSWSISAEAFFYIVYALCARWVTARRSDFLIAAAAFAYLLLFTFVWLCFVYSTSIDRVALAAFGPIATEQNGYQDSLLRWLYYFNPVVQIVHFIGGMAVAQLYLAARNGPNVTRRVLGAWLVPASVTILLGVHLYLYGVIAYHNGFVGRNASSFYGPLVVIMIYLITRFPTTALPRMLTIPVMVKLGEASYSLYLLHAFLAGILMRFQAIGLNRWVLWVLCLIVLLCVSRANYVCFERPARRMLRKLLD